MKEIIVFTDGGSRGNPGHSAIGVVINNEEYSQYLGKKTNNEAEYEALIFALEKIQEKEDLQNIIVHLNTDSELMYHQILGLYKIKQPHLQILKDKAKNIISKIKEFHIHHIRREFNKKADSLVNSCLDKNI